jgi:hypothetical protein
MFGDPDIRQDPATLESEVHQNSVRKLVQSQCHVLVQPFAPACWCAFLYVSIILPTDKDKSETTQAKTVSKEDGQVEKAST